MKNFKRNIIIGGLFLNAVICIILAFILPCDYVVVKHVYLGTMIAIANVLADILWLLVANRIINDYLKIKNG